MPSEEKKEAIFSMRDLVFFGFLSGPAGLSIALSQSLRRVGETNRAALSLRIGLALFVAELVLFAIAPISAIYIHLANGVLGKFAYDRWLFRPAREYVAAGGRFASNARLFAYWVVIEGALFASLWIVESVVA